MYVPRGRKSHSIVFFINGMLESSEECARVETLFSRIMGGIREMQDRADRSVPLKFKLNDVVIR